MEKVERITIFIDGGNFHHLVLKKLNTKELNFDFNAFVNFLVNSRKLSNEGAKKVLCWFGKREDG